MADPAPVEPTPAEPAAPTTVAATPPAEPTVAATPPTEPAKPVEPEKPAETTATIDVSKVALPENFTRDDAKLKSVADIISDASLSPQDRMQKLIDFHTAALQEASKKDVDYWTGLQKEWGEANKATYGQEPTKHPTIIAIGKAIDSLGEKPAAAFREALDMSGMGNHPAIIAGLGILATKLAEPSQHVTGSPPSKTAPKSLAEAFYGPNQQ